MHRYPRIIRGWATWNEDRSLGLWLIVPLLCLPPEVSCLFSPELQMVRLIQQACVERHGGWMCSDGLLPRSRHICDLSTHRYWRYPPGQDFCNNSSCKMRMNLNFGGFDLAGPQKALQKCFLSFDGMLKTKLRDAEVYFNLDEGTCQNLFVWQKLYWC